jgi:hypothetical protein
MISYSLSLSLSLSNYFSPELLKLRLLKDSLELDFTR